MKRLPALLGLWLASIHCTLGVVLDFPSVVDSNKDPPLLLSWMILVASEFIRVVMVAIDDLLANFVVEGLFPNRV